MGFRFASRPTGVAGNRYQLTRSYIHDVSFDQVNFDLTPSGRDTVDHSSAPPPPPPVRKSSAPGSAYVYESDTVRRAYPITGKMPGPAAVPSSPLSLAPATPTAPPPSSAKDIPYHAREDSKPFTYGLVTNGHPNLHQNGGSANGGGPTATSTPTSPSVQRRNWKDSSGGGGQATPSRPVQELESPSLVRKFSNGADPRPSAQATPTSPRPLRKLGESLSNGSSGLTPPASGNASNILPVATSSPRLDTPRNRNPSQSEMKSPAPVSLEETIQDISTSPDSSRYVALARKIKLRI